YQSDRGVVRYCPRGFVLEPSAQPSLHSATLVFGRHRKRIGRAGLRLQLLSPMRGKYVARRLRGQPVDRTAPDGSRFDYLHVIAAGAPPALLSRNSLI